MGFNEEQINDDPSPATGGTKKREIKRGLKELKGSQVETAPHQVLL